MSMPNPSSKIRRPALTFLAGAVLLAIGVSAGLWWGQRSAPSHGGVGAQPTAASASVSAPSDRKVLYWYDPMSPNTRFDKPGKSPFMDMPLVPMYADGGDGERTVKISAAVAQNLGVRLADVTRASAAQEVRGTGLVTFNDRDVAVVQARTGGFIERVPPLAPGDIVAAGAVLAEVLVPEWAAAQQEAMALKRLGQQDLLDAAVERMRLSGMPDDLIRKVLSTGQVQSRIVITSPRAGVIQELDVRSGMTVMAGATLARINGIGSVWLEVAVPEAQSGQVRVGQSARIELASMPGEVLVGKVSALLPALNDAARTLRVRVELSNPGGRLRPGLSAQVSLLGQPQDSALFVPTEAVIRTGQRALVMLALEEGRYVPVEVTLGGEVGSQTVIKAGLSEGQKVVASGQFLIDSEASLKGVRPRQDASPKGAGTEALLHQAEAVVEGVQGLEITLRHGPFKSLNMAGMTMTFPLANEHAAHGIQRGDQVKVSARQTEKGLLIVRVEKQGGQP